MFKRSDFKKLDLLGSGKKNTKIFKVQHLQSKKIYVLKEVEAKSLEKLNEYKEEAVQLAKVQNHPNILQFFGYYFYETPHNTYKLGIVCEYINGSYNLEIIYRRRESKNSHWKEEEILKMAYSIIDAFAFLQQIGICHRDIKPANLFLLDSHEIKVIDFGESKEHLLDDEDPHAMATIRGTPQYLSPILWKAHVLNPGSKHVEHNIYKSDVFSAGLVLFQLAAMKDVTGFNQKTQNTDGERLIKENLDRLSKKYSSTVVDIIRKMLIYDEDKRPSFIELGKLVFGDSYSPGDRSYRVSSVKKTTSPDEKMFLFKQYTEKHKLKFNMNKITFWFEYGGNMIAKFYANKEDKWKLIGKYKNEFPSHCICLFIDDDTGHFIIGGTDGCNTFHYRDGQIVKKASMLCERSFMSCVYVKGCIFAIGGYEFNEKIQLGSIETYDIEKDKWSMNLYEDLKVPRSQASALLFNSKEIYVFGGYNKNYGTLNSIERVSLINKTSELMSIKLPIPLRRFGSLKISESRVLVMGGITRLCKETDNVYIVDFEKSTCSKFNSLPRPGIIEHEILIDEVGQVHLFFENNYGTSPPFHVIYNYLDFN